MNKPRFPWDTVKEFTVQSLADGRLIIEPKYVDGVPGCLTRIGLAFWCVDRLAKRKPKQPQPIG